MDGISLTFNADVAKLQQLGLDPTTSEGKQKLVTLFLEAIDIGCQSAAEEWSEEESEILQEFLKEI
jgi:hypothetical protein